MIKIYADGVYYGEVTHPNEAIRVIRELKRRGHRVEWTCYDPEDNEVIWQNT